MFFQIGKYDFNIVEHRIANKPTNASDERNTQDFARKTLDDINMWIENCDQKAGLLLTMIGIIVTILFSTDFTINKLTLLVVPIKQSIQGIPHEFSIYRLLCIITVLSTLSFMAKAVFFLFKTLKANLTENGKSAEGRISASLIYYGSISQMNNSDYKNSAIRANELDEILSQIHINAIICNSKFANYNKGLKNLRYGLYSMAVMLLMLLPLGI